MEANHIVALVVIGLGFVSVMSIAMAASESFKLMRRKVSLSGFEGGFLGIARWLLLNGVAGLQPLSRRLLKANIVNKSVGEVVVALTQKGFETSAQSTLSCCLAALLVVFCIGSIACRSILGGLVCWVCALAFLFSWIKTTSEKRLNQMRETIPETLQALNSSFSSGLSLQQSFEQLAHDSKGGMKVMFTKASHVLQTGGTVSDALSTLRLEQNMPELTFIVVALDIQHQTGGSISRVLAAAQEMVRTELNLARSLRVQTAQARLSARIVGLLPIVLLVVFSFVSPGFLDPFFSSTLGLAIFGAGICLQALGIAFVRKALQIN